ncbi:MAG: DUF3179 domain-containing protein [Actinomycetota bacterium]|nr:DUF3179 domain-containing protein [Actinomycetota bacterium]
MNARRTSILLVSLAVVISACTAGSDSEVTGASAGTSPTIDEAAPAETSPPDVDMTKHDVPLDQIYFDTFDGNSVPLSESTPELRQRLLDAIPPIDEPRYGGVAEGGWLLPDDPVVGYIAGDQAYAYPFKILNFHEIVNDTLDGIPVLISYCPLCRSAVVYDRRVDGRVTSFGNTSALYESDLVMVDRSTGSYWWQVPGRAIVGPLTGTQLTTLPSRVATWADWAESHPDTLVLTRDTGFEINYERDPFAGYDQIIDSGGFAFPVGEDARDPRLAPSALVVGVSVDGTTHAYPVEGLEAPLNDVVSGDPVVIFPNAGGASVYSSVVDGEVFEFESGEAGFTDLSTGSVWSPDGRAVSGPLAGTSLEPIPSRTTFWFALVGAFPDLTLVG